MQVISFMAIKGGVGKTTMAFQFAKYLQENNKSTLLIDLDSQKSLTGTFETKDFNFKDKHNISEILSNPQIGIIATTVEKNIDVIPSTSNLEEIADNLATKPNKELLLFMWFVKNSKELNQKYDYISCCEVMEHFHQPYKEFELLSYFLENQGIALSREKILNNVWNYDYFGDARTIDTHVKKLRSKLGDKGEYIKTIWGMGYKFEVQSAEK